MHNTLDEISEAQRTAQLECLTTTRTGRSILARLGFADRAARQADSKELPGVLRSLRITPVPRNVHPEHNRARRTARAQALTELYAGYTGALFVDAAKYPDRPGAYVAVAVRATSGEVYSACSVCVPSARHTEETTIALALTDPGCTSVE